MPYKEDEEGIRRVLRAKLDELIIDLRMRGWSADDKIKQELHSAVDHIFARSA